MTRHCPNPSYSLESCSAAHRGQHLRTSDESTDSCTRAAVGLFGQVEGERVEGGGEGAVWRGICATNGGSLHVGAQISRSAAPNSVLNAGMRAWTDTRPAVPPDCVSPPSRMGRSSMVPRSTGTGYSSTARRHPCSRTSICLQRVTLA